MSEDPCYHCHTLQVRSERMARRVQRYGVTNHDETALIRLAYQTLVNACTTHFHDTKHVVDFGDAMVAVLERPFRA